MSNPPDNLEQQPARAETPGVGIPETPRSGETSAAAQALEQILALAEQAERMSPPVTTIGHRDPWVDVGKRAAKIARETLEADES